MVKKQSGIDPSSMLIFLRVSYEKAWSLKVHGTERMKTIGLIGHNGLYCIPSEQYLLFVIRNILERMFFSMGYV